MAFEITKCYPVCKDFIWGGYKLKQYGKKTEADKIAETWELSCHKDGPCLTDNGKLLSDEYCGTFGKNCEKFENFPVLIKLIDSADNLSVQVHPSDDYAMKNEGEYGKTEMWYVVDSEEGAGIYLGFNRDVNKDEFMAAVEAGNLTDLLNFYEVKKGEWYFIPSGTVHAIGKGVTICEIQQSSNLTYRIYDYKRKGADGKERPLHVEKALKVADFSKFDYKPFSKQIGEKTLIGASSYFSTYALRVDGKLTYETDGKSFVSFTCVEGNGKIGDRDIGTCETFYVPAEYGKFSVSGEMTVIAVEVRKYYVGIDLGGTYIKGGIVDDRGNIIVSAKVPTEVNKGSEGVMDNIDALINTLLESTTLKKSDLSGVGMGVPGMIDSKAGIVVYSNNFDWENVDIAGGMQKRLGLKIRIANDANVAALGESVFGAGSKYENCVLLTLGTGLGAGIIADNKLLEGNKSAGAEIGHMVIVDGGEPCTCGRKGCFEAYASATALIRDTKRAMQEHKDSKMWEKYTLETVGGRTAFEYKDSDKYAKAVIDNYIEKLACGITNVANVFRPQVIMLGGGVCAQGDNLIVPVKKIVDKDIFGGKRGPECDIKIAKLGNTAGILGAVALCFE